MPTIEISIKIFFKLLYSEGLVKGGKMVAGRLKATTKEGLEAVVERY